MPGEFLGVGWAFPIQVNAKGGNRLQRYEEDIKEACRIILGTALGERAMRPDFGCALYDLVFDPSDASLAGKIEFYVENALKRWEPRIEVKMVEARLSEEKVLVDVSYVIRRTNTEDNFVFPFFRKGLP
jgi:hypothetical protein